MDEWLSGKLGVRRSIILQSKHTHTDIFFCFQPSVSALVQCWFFDFLGGLAKTWHWYDQICHFLGPFFYLGVFFNLLFKDSFFYIFHTRNGNDFASFARTTLAESGKQHFVMSQGEPISYRLRLTRLKPKCFNWKLLKKRSWSVCWTFRASVGRLLLQENW